MWLTLLCHMDQIIPQANYVPAIILSRAMIGPPAKGSWLAHCGPLWHAYWKRYSWSYWAYAQVYLDIRYPCTPFTELCSKTSKFNNILDVTKTWYNRSWLFPSNENSTEVTCGCHGASDLKSCIHISVTSFNSRYLIGVILSKYWSTFRRNFH